VAQPDWRNRRCVGRNVRQPLDREPGTGNRDPVVGKILLGIILVVILLMVASWTLGEFLRQRKDK